MRAWSSAATERRFAYAIAVDDSDGHADAAYVQLTDRVVKLPQPAAAGAEEWDAEKWNSIPVGGDIAFDGKYVYVTGQGGTSFEAYTGNGSLQATSADTLRDVYIVKLNATTGVVEYATFLGGQKVDTGFGIAVDDNQNIYVVGSTGSDNSFPTLDDDSYMPLTTSSGGNEAFRGGSGV